MCGVCAQACMCPHAGAWTCQGAYMKVGGLWVGGSLLLACGPKLRSSGWVGSRHLYPLNYPCVEVWESRFIHRPIPSSSAFRQRHLWNNHEDLQSWNPYSSDHVGGSCFFQKQRAKNGTGDMLDAGEAGVLALLSASSSEAFHEP